MFKDKYGCSEQYRGDTTLCILSLLVHSFQVVIDQSIVATGHGKILLMD